MSKNKIDKPLLENEEIFRLYDTGVRDFTDYKLYLSDPIGNDLSGVNFSGLDLSDSYIEGINLSGANLSGTYFNSACLDHANLKGANLSGARLSRASLIMADLTNANLTDACLFCTEIIESNLTNATFVGADIEDIFLEENIYRNTVWIDGSIRNE